MTHLGMSKENNAVAELPDGVVLRGRNFTKSDLILIQTLVNQHFTSGRTKISEEVCKRLDWRQENGWLKDRACRDVLRRLETIGVLVLPLSRSSSRSPQYSRWSPTLGKEVQGPLITKLSGSIQIEVAKGGSLERRWNSLVSSFHYLGFKVAVGRCLKFLVRDEESTIAAIALSEAAWAIGSRDHLLPHFCASKEDVANNSRFLILPNVRVQNLASQILSLVPHACVPVWEKFYGRRLRFLETFVDMGRFKGTSYLAANWLRIGTTKGYCKSGRIHRNGRSEKAIFLYALQLKDRRSLMSILQEKGGAV
jgi:Domain of unknown function (DUF4338)